MRGRTEVPPCSDMDPTDRQTPRRSWLLALPFLILLTGGVGSCYKPDLNNAIYQCDGYACPSGLVCNSDKFCVYHPVEGCTNGGVPGPDNILLCPGATNSCASGYQVCTSVPPEVVCQPPSASQPDLGASSACRPCCSK